MQVYVETNLGSQIPLLLEANASKSKRDLTSAKLVLLNIQGVSFTGPP